ncbi:MAG: hybrid sensor histidine kinase/response regulator [Candidatus Dormibacteria bacterium]
MSVALSVMGWALGVALLFLSAVTLYDWGRNGGRSRQYLALSVGLLGGVALLSEQTAASGPARVAISSALVVMFMGSAFSMVMFRESLIPGSRWALWLMALAAVVITTVAVTVNLTQPGGVGVTLSVSGLDLWVSLACIAGWCVLVGLSIAQLWLASGSLPAVQRARLRALTFGFTGLIIALIGDAAAARTAPSDVVQLTVTAISLLSMPLLAVAFSPPGWLRRLWRESEEVQFRRAIDDLLLYSPDVGTLSRRALEWPSRLLGGRGALIALDGSVVAHEGLDTETAGRLHADLQSLHESSARSVLTSLGPVAVAPLSSRAGSGYMAVLGGPFTPLFGNEEIVRLDQYRVSITVALDRVHLVEGMRRTAELLDLAYDAVFAWDVKTRQIQYWNRACTDLYGWEASEALGRDPAEITQSEFPVPLDEILHTLTESEHWEGEIVQYTKDGRRIPISARWALQRDPAGEPSSVLEINRDVSVLKQTAEELRRARDSAEQASNAKSEYLSRMSHELRTPLAAMLGFSDLLEMRDPREDQVQAIEAIQRAGSHLLSLVNDVLDIARIESGRETLALAPVDVATVFDECTGLVSQSARGRDMTLEVSVSPGLYVRADRQRLVQILLNLLSNAIKYGRPTGTVSLHAAALEGGDVEITVADDGPGLDEVEQAHLFQPFERLGRDRGRVQGTGLGLALVRQLTMAMGGAVGVRSARGAGSQFWVRLGGAAKSDETSVVPAAGPSVLSDVATDRTVLYAEDNLATINLVESIFALRPTVRLITAMQGSIAIQLAREHVPDLIILDLHLPDLNGDEVMRRLADDPRTAEIPVVIYSADATEKQVTRLLGEGAVAYVTKPARVTEFLAMLDRVLVEHPRVPEAAAPPRRRR